MRGEEIAYWPFNNGELIEYVNIDRYPDGSPLVKHQHKTLPIRVLLRPRNSAGLLGGLFWIQSLIEQGCRPPELVFPCMFGQRQDRINPTGDVLFTIMSSQLWLCINSATRAREVRKVLDKASEATGAPGWFTDWQGHDFSFRGMGGLEAAQLSGAGHLLFFTGTDTIPALDWVEDHYGIPEGYLLGGSVAATEHSVMCAGGQEGENETFQRLMDLYPEGILSVVSDTWDLWKVLTEILPANKEKIMARKGKLVIRPDSGDPADIVCGDPLAPAGSPASKGVIQLLWETFGGTTNEKFYKQLDEHVGCIYGDAISKERAEEITGRLAAKGFASSNIVFGVGSYTYQYNTRDTLSQAMKATWVEIDGQGKAIFKKPVTDNGVKNSATGRLAVFRNDTGLFVVENASKSDEDNSLLRPVWRNGKFVDGAEETFDIVRARARRGQ